MFARILHRPAFAMVVSIIILFLGALGYNGLPRSQFPSIAPPTVLVFITYPGASAEVLVDSTLIPLERAINGVQGMRYMSSDATSAGEATIRIYFEPGSDPDLAVVNVQNRIAIVKNLLPPLVQREGIIVSQVQPSMLMYVNVFSTADGVDQKFLYNFTNNRILQEIRRVKGIGTATILGSRTYAMRIWLNPDRLRAYNLSTEEVMKALAEQSVIGSPGRLGQASGLTSQSIEYVLTYKGRYNTVEDYENVILRATPEGQIVRLKDVCGTKAATDPAGPGNAAPPAAAPGPQAVLAVDPHAGNNGGPAADKGPHAGAHAAKGAHGGGKPAPPGAKPTPAVELGSEFFDIYSDVDGHPSAAVVIKQNPGSNAAEVIAEVKKEFERIKKEEFPPGMDYEVTYDVSAFLEASIEQVKHTLFEAFVLVSIVVFLFLGDWRSTLIPILAVPVSLVGTFFVLQMMGQSINLITLFAMVLAIGVVVDDAIVVVEAVHAKMHERHLSPYRATQEVMHEISGAIIAITLVMTAVFVPVCFIPGPVGTFYRTFGVTMATSIVLSGLVALTLTPVLCAMILKPPHGAPVRRSTSPLARAFRPLLAVLDFANIVTKPFDLLVHRVTAGYAALLRPLVPRRALTLVVVAGFAAGVVGVNTTLPSGFIPSEDQGIIYGIIQTPPGSTLEYTNAKSHELQEIAKEMDEVTSVSSLAGYEILTEGRGSNAGTCIINLKPWSKRAKTARQLIEELEHHASKMSNVKVEFFEPPAVPGFGAAGGFSLRLLDKGSVTDYKRLGEVNDAFMAALEKRPELRNLFTFYTSDYPQYELIIDNDKAMQKGVSMGKALDNLNVLIGSTYEQGFILFGQFYKVYVQSSPEFRRMPEDLDNMFVKSEREVEVKDEKTGTVRKVRVDGEMVPYSAFMKVKKKQGLNEITRYNLYPSATIQGAPAPGFSSGQALKAIQEVAKEVLPQGYGLGWEGLSYDEAKKGTAVPVPGYGDVEVKPAVFIFLIVVVFVYLVLVGQYESFIIPLAVILSLPIGIFGSFLFLQAMGLANDVYAQIGLVMLVGLLGKNAILIVEFAVQRRREGVPLADAAIEGGKLRFRPIQMTSFAFIAGLIPLVVATGAGAIGNRTIGTTAAGGMLVGTVLGVVFIPGLYYLFGTLADGRKLLDDESDRPLSEPLAHHLPEPHTPGPEAEPAAGDAEHLPFDAGPAEHQDPHPPAGPGR